MKTKKYNILVTRPKHQAEELCRLIEQQYWNPIRFPTLEIVAVYNPKVKHQLEAIEQYDWLIFISANAVNFALKANDGKIDPFMETTIAAVGSATKKSLKIAGLSVSLVPEKHFNSEGLLETEQMRHVKGKTCLIVRGKGGRETLANSLRERGAKVDYLEVYSRNMPVVDHSIITTAIQDQTLDAITITSGDALNNLLLMVNDKLHKQLFSVPLIVVSDRIWKIADNIGFKRIIVTEKAGNEGIIDAVIKGLSIQPTNN